MAAILPHDEKDRLITLQHYAILDTPSEEVFDRITRLAARLFSVPVALITLIDTDRQWFKSCYGVSISETSRDIAFCAHTILSSEPLVVTDATLDPRFVDNPLVTGDYHIRFYAGVPLVMLDGSRLGTLCILDTKPRILSPDELANLKDMAASVVDVLEFKRKLLEETRQAIYESEARYRTLIEQIPAVTFVSAISDDYRTVYISPQIKELLGYTRDEWLAEPDLWTELVHPEDRERVYNLMIESAKTLKPFVAEYRFVTRDNRVVWVHDKSLVVLNEQGQPLCFQGVLFDITEQRRLEDEQHKASKLKSLGLLAGGIAHDFNNLLTVVVGNISLLQMEVEDLGLDALTESIQESEQVAFRAKELTQQLLTFAKGGAPVKQPASLAALIQEATSFAVRGTSVQVEYELADDTWLVEIDHNQIGRVINNLVLNAVQAMPKGGKVRLQTRNQIFEPDDITSLIEHPQRNYVAIAITDQGGGIDNETQARIFDPYFTTKPGGSGLGLATAYSIVKRHDGFMKVTSTPPLGTTFTIYLPALTTSAVMATTPAKANRQVLSGQGRILVMDDQDSIRRLMNTTLQRLGYEAEVVADGAAAVECYRQACEMGQPFAAVILDLTVPGGVGGLEVVRQLQDVNCEVKAIAFSGYSNDPVIANCQAYGFVAGLSKPCPMEEISRVLKQVVGVVPV